MGTALAAIISSHVPASQLSSKFGETTRLLSLGQDIYMLPMTQEAISLLTVEDEDVFTISNFEILPVQLFGILMNFSGLAKIGYIEIEPFGVSGQTAGLVFDNNVAIYEKTKDAQAANQALKHLGVTRNANADELESLNIRSLLISNNLKP